MVFPTPHPKKRTCGNSVSQILKCCRLVSTPHISTELQVVDLGEIFKGYNARYGNYSVHSLQHEARVLLGKTARGAHDPAWDAQVSVALYKTLSSNFDGSFCHTLLSLGPSSETELVVGNRALDAHSYCFRQMRTCCSCKESKAGNSAGAHIHAAAADFNKAPPQRGKEPQLQH